MNSVRIAIVGRPNVGKSRLFNRLVQKRVAIVHDQAGVTRDIIEAPLGEGIFLMDTGGVGVICDKLSSSVEHQVDLAIQQSDVIFFVVDGRMGITNLDQEIAQRLRTSDRKVFLVVNKIDSEKQRFFCDEFFQLGLEEPLAVSAEHGYGEEALRKIIRENSEHASDLEAADIQFCLVGRPNVGKSSIANALLNEPRLIESPIAGTTRDAVHCQFQYQNYTLELIDTAGLRAKKKIDSSVEFFSTLRSRDAILEADVVVYVIDALTGITRQDQQRIRQIMNERKCLLLVVNKWDLAREDLLGCTRTEFQKRFLEAIQAELPGQKSVIFTSAKNGNPDDLLKAIIELYKRAQQTISTGKLNRIVQNLLERQPPAFVGKKRFKVYYLVCCQNFPFKFKLFCNKAELLNEPYKRYLENGIRNAFDLEGCPIVFEFLSKEPRYCLQET